MVFGGMDVFAPKDIHYHTYNNTVSLTSVFPIIYVTHGHDRYKILSMLLLQRSTLSPEEVEMIYHETRRVKSPLPPADDTESRVATVKNEKYELYNAGW